MKISQSWKRNNGESLAMEDLIRVTELHTNRRKNHNLTAFSPVSPNFMSGREIVRTGGWCGDVCEDLYFFEVGGKQDLTQEGQHTVSMCG